MAAPATPPTIPPEPVDADRDGNLAIIVLQSVLLAIATALVVARLYVRSMILKSIGLDEVFIVIALVSSVSAGEEYLTYQLTSCSPLSHLLS